MLNKQVREFRAHTTTVNEVSFDADGEYVASCSDDGTIVISVLKCFCEVRKWKGIVKLEDRCQ